MLQEHLENVLRKRVLEIESYQDDNGATEEHSNSRQEIANSNPDDATPIHSREPSTQNWP